MHLFCTLIIRLQYISRILYLTSQVMLFSLMSHFAFLGLGLLMAKYLSEIFSLILSIRLLSHGWLSRRPLVAQRRAARIPFHDDYEKSVAVTSDRLSLPSLELNARYNARTRRGYCCVGLKRTKKEKERGRERWMHPIICDRRKNGLFWTIFEDLRRDETKFLNYFRMSVGFWRTVWHDWVFATKITKNTNTRDSVPPRDRSAVTLR
jgi:hypothetical protein